jgi:hypothetical protein
MSLEMSFPLYRYVITYMKMMKKLHVKVIQIPSISINKSILGKNKKCSI